MARYHRRTRRRYRKPTTWQSMNWVEEITGNASTSGPVVLKSTKLVYPGVQGSPRVGEGDRAFDQPLVLERMRGMMTHDLPTSSNTVPEIVPVNVAALRVPAEVALGVSGNEIPNLANNLEGDDYFFYHASLCGDQVSTQASTEMVDNKAKRRFEVGDAILFLLNLTYPQLASGSFQIKLAFGLNLRILWKIS